MPESESGIEVVEVMDSNKALESINRAEIDVQITTAKQWPRSLRDFKDRAMEYATLDEDTAASMFYVLPRGGKKIEGPSVRMAEVVGTCWGNIRYEADILDIGEKFVTAMGAAFDLERNVAARIRVQRRITDKFGRRFNDDVIQTTCNAAMAIALRNAIFKVVPQAMIKPILEAAKETAIGKSKTMQERRATAMDMFEKMKVSREKVLQFLGRKGEEDVTMDDLLTLRGLITAIRDGEATVDAVFSQVSSDSNDKSARAQVLDKLDEKPSTKASDTSTAGQSSSEPPRWARIAIQFAEKYDVAVEQAEKRIQAYARKTHDQDLKDLDLDLIDGISLHIAAGEIKPQGRPKKN